MASQWKKGFKGVSNVVPQYDIQKITDNNEFMRFCSIVVAQIINGINGNLDFNNLKTQTLGVTFSSANTDVKVTHSLNKTGINYFPVNLSAALTVYNGVGAATNSSIYLRSSAIGNVTLILF